MGVQSFELREFTQAVYAAREAAMQRVSGQASALGASGVVGMQIGHTVDRTRSAAEWAWAAARWRPQ